MKAILLLYFLFVFTFSLSSQAVLVKCAALENPQIRMRINFKEVIQATISVNKRTVRMGPLQYSNTGFIDNVVELVDSTRRQFLFTFGRYSHERCQVAVAPGSRCPEEAQVLIVSARFSSNAESLSFSNTDFACDQAVFLKEILSAALPSEP